MVNNSMSETNQLPQPAVAPQPQKRPNDTGSIGVEGSIKIFDPASRKVFVEQKA